MKKTVVLLLLLFVGGKLIGQVSEPRKIYSGKLLASYCPKKDKSNVGEKFCDGDAHIDERTGYFISIVIPTKDTQKIGEFLKTGIDVNSIAGTSTDALYNRSILMFAMYKADIKTVKFLLDNGASPNMRVRVKYTDMFSRKESYGYSWYPLECAVDNKNTDLVDLLIKYGAKIDNCLEGMKSIATGNNDIQMLTYLGNISGSTAVPVNAIATMLENGYQHDPNTVTPEIVHQLIRRGADINAFAPSGRTALLNAIQNPRVNNKAGLVKALLESNANPNKPDVERPGGVFVFYPTSPLMAAVRENRLDIVKLLVEKGANVTEGKLLQFAKSNDIREYLILKGAKG